MEAGRLVVLLRGALHESTAPLHETITSGIRGLVLDGKLATDARLPAERQLAARLGCARATVTAAYDRLRAEGYLVSRRGSGTTVSSPEPAPARPDDLPAAAASVPDIDLTVAALPAPAVLPDLVRAAAEGLTTYLAGHGLHPLGIPALRSAVAARYTARGLPTSPDEVLITQGALHGWDLLLRVLTAPGQRVVVEQPTYPGMLDAVSAHRLRAVPLPVDANGWDPSQLPAPRRAQVALYLVTPDGQNPTGYWASPSARRSLLTALAPDVPLVVDETFADLHLGGERSVPMAGYARRRCLTLGSMSKAFWAGLRVGWIRGPAATVRRLGAARAGQDLGTPILEQLIAVELLARADRLLAERRATLRENRDALVSALPPEWRVAPPVAGLVLWVETPVATTPLAHHALAAGVRVTPGSRFAIDGAGDRWLRLPFTAPAAVTVEAVRRLAELAAHLPASRPRRRATAWTA